MHNEPMTNAEQSKTTTIGTRVSYEDMANPLCEGVVCDIETTKWGVRYVIAWNGYRAGTTSYSDLRQRGWTIGA